MPNAKLGREGGNRLHNALNTKLNAALQERGVDEEKIAETVAAVEQNRTPTPITRKVMQGSGKLYNSGKLPPIHKVYYDALVAKLGELGKGYVALQKLGAEVNISTVGTTGVVRALITNGYIRAEKPNLRKLGTYIEILK